MERPKLQFILMADDIISIYRMLSHCNYLFNDRDFTIKRRNKRGCKYILEYSLTQEEFEILMDDIAFNREYFGY